MMVSRPNVDDVRLREGLVAGAEQALAEAYDSYCPLVYGAALRITRDQGAAEEIAQDVFVDLWRRPERFDPARAPLGGWLAMIARRRGIDWVRQRRTRDNLQGAADGNTSRLEDEVLAMIGHAQVRRAITELPPTHRQVILLAYYEGLTYRAVATTLGIPEGTAKWRLNNALRRIGQQLTADGFGDTSDLG